MGTLLELEQPAPRLRRALADRLGITVSDAQARDAVGAEIAYYRAHLDEGRDRASLARLRGRCAEVLRAALPACDAISAASSQALTRALLASLHFTVFPDVVPALSAARARGQRLVVLSNWDVSLTGVLEAAGLSRFLHGVVSSAAAGARKPSAAIFEHGLGVAGVRASDAIHVGDSIEEDVRGARAAQIEPVLIRRDQSPGPPGVRTIATLTELG